MNRPSRSQQNLLEFIDAFVKEHGYGPSYREVMTALDYKSVSTVAIHINGLMAKGKLKKQGRSARSLEVVKAEGQKEALDKNIESPLVEKITQFANLPEASQADFEVMATVFEKLKLPKAAATARKYMQKTS